MVIGIDASRANLENKTGVEVYSYFLIQELKKIIGAPHKVILYSREPLRGELGDLPPGWEWRQVKSPVFIPFRGKKPYLWTQLGLSFEMLVRPPDVLFVPSHALPLIHPKNSVVTIHDLGFLRFPESYHPLARAYCHFAAKFAVRHAKKIIAISEFTKKELVEIYGADPQKISVIPLAYDSWRFQANLDEEKKKQVLEKYFRDPKLQIHPNAPNMPYIFYVGRLEKKKNLVTLIRAFEILTHNLQPTTYNLVLAGSPAYGFPEIQQAINKSSIRDRISVLNYVPSEDLPYLMSGAAVFVFPSLYEGFGIPVLEAQACGTPVVASDIPALREIACHPERSVSEVEGSHLVEVWLRPNEGGAALFAAPQSPVDFASKINFLLEDSSSPTVQTVGLPARQELIKRGLEQVKKYSWRETAKKTFETLTQF